MCHFFSQTSSLILGISQRKLGIQIWFYEIHPDREGKVHSFTVEIKEYKEKTMRKPYEVGLGNPMEQNCRLAETEDIRVA